LLRRLEVRSGRGPSTVDAEVRREEIEGRGEADGMVDISATFAVMKMRSRQCEVGDILYPPNFISFLEF
jgi:hypothetical protein